MITVKGKRSFGSLGNMAAVIGLLAGVLTALAAGDPVSAGSSLTERQRQQVLDNSAAAVEQRNKQAQDTAERQKRLLLYQVRKNQRTNQKLQCQLAGQSNC